MIVLSKHQELQSSQTEIGVVRYKIKQLITILRVSPYYGTKKIGSNCNNLMCRFFMVNNYSCRWKHLVLRCIFSLKPNLVICTLQEEESVFILYCKDPTFGDTIQITDELLLEVFNVITHNPENFFQ